MQGAPKSIWFANNVKENKQLPKTNNSQHMLFANNLNRK